MKFVLSYLTPLFNFKHDLSDNPQWKLLGEKGKKLPAKQQPTQNSSTIWDTSRKMRKAVLISGGKCICFLIAPKFRLLSTAMPTWRTGPPESITTKKSYAWREVTGLQVLLLYVRLFLAFHSYCVLGNHNTYTRLLASNKFASTCCCLKTQTVVFFEPQLFWITVKTEKKTSDRVQRPWSLNYTVFRTFGETNEGRIKQAERQQWTLNFEICAVSKKTTTL